MLILHSIIHSRDFHFVSSLMKMAEREAVSTVADIATS